MKVLVTGVAGFVGSHLAEALLEEHEVIGIDNFSNGTFTNMVDIYDNPNFHFVNCSISESMTQDWIWQDVDTVYHLACAKNRLSDINPWECIETNCRQTLMLWKKCEAVGVRKVVHSSTGSVYGNHENKPIEESSSKNPLSIYGINKLAGESYLRMFDFEKVVLRYFHLYGSRSTGVIGKFIDNHRAGKPLQVTGTGDQQRCFTHVDDVVTANLTAPPGVWNVCSGIRVTVNDIVRILGDVSGREPVVEHVPELKNDIMIYKVLSSLPIKWKKDLRKEIEILWNC